MSNLFPEERVASLRYDDLPVEDAVYHAWHDKVLPNLHAEVRSIVHAAMPHLARQLCRMERERGSTEVCEPCGD